MRRVGLAVLVVVGVVAWSTGCRPEEVNRWRLEHGLAPLVEPELSEVAARLTAVEEEMWRKASFSARVHLLDAAALGPSWRPGCPVAPSSLRRVEVSFWGFDDRGHTGEIVVHRDVALQVIAVLRLLWDARYPIRSLRPVAAFAGDDRASMRADNTSGFNCRFVAGTTRWSEHAYGRAIDLNPFENPWVDGATVDPPEAARFADRARADQGIIRPGDAAVRAFSSYGFVWGGNWRSSKDYQHFSTSGR